MSVIVTKADHVTDITYSLTEQKGTQWNFANVASGLTEPETLRVQHFMRPPGAKGTDRHQIVLQKAIVEDASNNYLVGSVSLLISVPRSSEFTLAMVKDLLAQLSSYINVPANISTIMNGGTPEGDFNVSVAFVPAIA